jgi:hypothetical protein
MANKMIKFQRVAFIKCGWAEKYDGDTVIGRHRYIKKYAAHEKHNFARDPVSGCFLVYVPPVGGGQVAPSPLEREGWLLIFVAAEEGRGRLKVVGWYNNATFLPDYNDRGPDFPAEGRAALSYCISAPEGVRIPVDKREVIVPGRHFGNSSVVYIRGNGNRDKDLWRKEFMTIARTVIRRYTGDFPGGRDVGY